MGTWCTAGVAEDFARGHRENAFYDARKRAERAEREIEKLKAKIVELEETYIERDDDSL